MAHHSGWYPPGQVCAPPELPTYLRNVHDIKPITGVPTDEEMIGIHTVIQAANRVSGVPGMQEPILLVRLADHLFHAQMARYRSKYSLITFPSDATYSPPVLPAHMTVGLRPISGSPSDDEIMKVQDAVQSYQELRRFPSMFDELVNMELSQHLFDIQMARHMRRAGESRTSIPQSAAVVESAMNAPKGNDRTNSYERSRQAGSRHTYPAETVNTADEIIIATNNAGMGANSLSIPQLPCLTTSTEVCQLLDRSNQLIERSSQLLEQTNKTVERYSQSSSHTEPLAECLDQLFERYTRFVLRTDQSECSVERFNQLLERFNQLTEQSGHYAREANGLVNAVNHLAEQANKPIEKLGDILKNINKVLVGIQHAIIRNHKDNTLYVVDCLVNEKGQTPNVELGNTFRELSETANFSFWGSNKLSVVIDGASQDTFMDDVYLGNFLRFYGLGEELLEGETAAKLKVGSEKQARQALSEYLSSCLA